VHSIADQLGRTDVVPCVWVEDQFAVHTVGFERMVEFVADTGRDASVASAMLDECRRLHPIDVRHRRMRKIELRGGPRCGAEVRFHKLRNIRATVHREEINGPGTDGRGAEAIGVRDGPRRQIAAVGPAHDSHAIFVDDAAGNQIVHTALDILKVSATPVLANHLAKFLAVAIAAARIWQEDHVAFGGEHLQRVQFGPENETVVGLTIWPSMQDDEERVGVTGLMVWRR
jgi:hypothetical protein